MISRLIKQIKLEVNDGKELYTSQDGFFTEIFTANLLRNYTWQQLSQNELVLFLPLGETRYLVRTPNAAAANDLNGVDDAWIRRARKYCDPASATHLRPVVKIISLLDLFPRMPDAVFRNLNKIKITISWAESTDLLTYRGNDGTGRVYLLKVDLLEDYYVPEPTTAIVETEQKINEQQPDIIQFVDPMVRAVKYTPGMQIPIAIAHNLESVMVFQLAAR